MSLKKRIWRLIIFSSLLISVIVLLFALALSLYVYPRLGKTPSADERAAFEKYENYVDGEFRNQEEIIMNIAKINKEVSFTRFLFNPPNAPPEPLPVLPLAKSDFPGTPADFELVWLGHSSMIIELSGVRILTDPVFGNASPVPFSVMRFQDSPLKRTELPPVDIVLISHDHYDHLEYETMRYFAKSTEELPIFVVPLGVGARLRGWGIPADKIKELNWDDSVEVKGINITACPARHFSGRTGADRGKTLWSSYVLKSDTKKIFFSGDSGYGIHFKKIGEQYGPFDLACIETGSWNEHWANVHMFPEESVQAAEELNAERYLPIHWAVFDLALHRWDESIERAVTAAEENQAKILTPRMGERIQPETSSTEYWWREVSDTK